MVKLFGILLKILPVAGGALVLTAIIRSARSGVMDHRSLALIGLGFLFFLALFLKIEASSLRYYLNLTIISVELIGILTILYLFSYNHYARWDLTRDSLYSLSPQTTEILANLRQKVEIEALVVPKDELPLRQYLKLYTAESDRISITITNPYKAVTLFDIPTEEIQPNDIHIRCGEGDNFEKTSLRYQGADDLHALESDLTNGILTVVQTRRPRLYFTAGHGEKPAINLPGEQGSKRSIYRLAKELEGLGFDIRDGLNIQTDRIVPDDCDMLGVVGPATDFTIDEILSLTNYLDRGGRMILLLDPPERETAKRPNMAQLLERYGVQISEDLVWDSGAHAAEFNELVPLAGEYSPIHPITERLQGAIGPIAMRKACAIEKDDKAPKDLSVQPILFSSPRTWTITLEEYAAAARAGAIVPPSPDQIKPHALGMAIGPSPQAAGGMQPKIVVFGDSDFVSNAQLGSAQLTLAYMSVGWLTDQTNMLAIVRPESAKEPITLERKQQTLISIFSVVIVPFVVFFGGLAYTTIRRRKR